jgi:hypothetical protein
MELAERCSYCWRLSRTQNPDRHPLKDRIHETIHFASNAAQVRDGQTVPDLYRLPTSDESTKKVSNRMPCIDECFSSSHDQDIKPIFDELRGSSDLSWEGFFNWEDLY